MRRRLVVSTLVLSIVAVALLGIPLAFVASWLVLDETHRRVQHDADAVAAAVQIRRDQGERIDEDDLTRVYQHQHVTVRYPSGEVVRAGGGAGGAQVRAQSRTTGGALVVVSTPRSEVDRQQVSVVLLVAVIGFLAVAATVGLAFLEARRLSMPLRDLADRADRLGSGDALPARGRYGIAELDRVAEVLDNSAMRVRTFLAAERAFATDASHQLRTPLTALSMRLEEIASSARSPDVVEEEVQAALAQVQRLAEVVEQLLAAARSGRDAELGPTDVDEVVDQQLAEWDTAFRRASRTLVREGDRGLRARASKANLSQVVATLLDNALVHGDGVTTVRMSATAQSVVVEVADEGDGVPAELVQRIFDRHVSGGDGTGLGLALARSLAEADGGRLTLARERPARFAVFLRPVRDEAPPHRVVGGPA